MNEALAKRIVRAAGREDAAWKKLVKLDAEVDPDPLDIDVVATEYAEAALKLSTEIDNHFTMERMREK